MTWPPHPAEFHLASLVDELTSQALPAGPLQEAQTISSFFSERAGAVASAYEDIWTLLLLGSPRRNWCGI